MPRLKFIMVPVIVFCLFSSSALFIVGIALTSPSDLIEVSPEYKKKSKIATFITAGIHLLISGACGIYTYGIKRNSET